MASELIAGLGLFKSMIDMAKGLKDMNDATVRYGAVIELQEKIFSAQAQQTALIERIADLEKEVASFEAWESEKQRYHLQSCAPGAFAYVLKRSEARGEPGHAICAACYERRRKSILQSNGKMMIHDHAWVCLTREPLHEWRIWIANYDRDQWAGHYSHMVFPITTKEHVPETLPNGLPRPNTQTTTLVVGKLYIHALSTSLPEAAHFFRFVGSGSKKVNQIWPSISHIP